MATKKQSKKDLLIEESAKVFRKYSNKDLTLRQIYYRLVANHIIPNKQSEYKYLSSALVDGRLDGRIPFSRFVDLDRSFSAGDRQYRSMDGWHSTYWSMFQSAWRRYKLPRWYEQIHYIEVWCEKKALTSMFQPPCRDRMVTCGICKGYPSLTYLKETADRIKSTLNSEENTFEDATILYFGDFDPTGLDIERYVRETLQDTFGVAVEIKRMALTQDQVVKYNLPPMPTKKSDSRSKAHIEKYGSISSVELDALDPDVLEKMIYDAIDQYFDSSLDQKRSETELEIWSQLREYRDELLDQDALDELVDQEAKDPKIRAILDYLGVSY